MTLYSPYCTASGLAALAFADPELRQQMQMRHPFAVEAIQVWPSEAKLERFLKEARARGFVLPPFCDKASFRLAARPKLASTGRLLGIFGAAWHAVPGAADGGTKTVLDALRAAAAHLPDERCGRGKGADKR